MEKGLVINIFNYSNKEQCHSVIQLHNRMKCQKLYKHGNDLSDTIWDGREYMVSSSSFIAEVEQNGI